METAILILSFLLLIALGVPVAYSIGLSALFTLGAAFAADGLPLLSACATVAQRMATGLDSFALMAIPFFILAGELMNRGGIARRLIDLAMSLAGMLPGSLAVVNVLACMLFGAISGSAVAAASAIGSLLQGRMEREGYEPGFGAAVNIGSATTGLIIPPSNALIVYALASGGVSISALFLAGYLPGLLMGGLIGVAALLIAARRGYPRAAGFSLGRFALALRRAFWSLLLLIVVVGGIVGGVFTATEASAIAVAYSLALGLAYGELRLADLRPLLLRTAGSTSIVLLLVAASMALSWVMAFEDLPQAVAAWMLSLSDRPWVLLLLINVILLLAGTFMDMTPAILIFTPIFLPAALRIGMDPVHFGVMMVSNLCVGLCTPPVGSVLFVGAAVSGLGVRQLLQPLLPVFAAMLLALLLIIYVPGLSLWLPGLAK
jgi:tripartite ATP-independent transporter DctM subunit